MKIKRILSLFLMIVMIYTCTACTSNSSNNTSESSNVQSQDTNEQSTLLEENSNSSETSNVTSDAPIEDPLQNTMSGFTQFDTNLLSHIYTTQNDKNFIVSPLSLKYALILTAIGANGETQSELVHALGYNTIDECIAWADSYSNVLKDFENDAIKEAEMAEKYGEGPVDLRSLKIVNAVWHNTNRPGTILEKYMQTVQEHFNATASNVPYNNLVDTINKWAEENTNGLIKKLVSTLPENTNTVLTNALYLKSGWVNAFASVNTKKDDFTTFDGQSISKDFMYTREYFKYYKDNEIEIIILPLDGGIKFAAVRGNSTNLKEKLAQVTSTYIDLYIPKMEIESSFEQEMIDFLQTQGAITCFSDAADFSNLIDTPITISNVIQKAKLKTDEDGLEAAAVTGIFMTDTAIPEFPTPIEVRLDTPFQFYIYNALNETTNELLFAGQYIK